MDERWQWYIVYNRYNMRSYDRSTYIYFLHIYTPVAHSGRGGGQMVDTTIEHKEHTMRTLTGYVLEAMSTQTDITMILPSPLWNGAFCTLAFFVMSTHEAVANMMQGVASAFHGETHTMGGTPALSKLATGTSIHRFYRHSVAKPALAGRARDRPGPSASALPLSAELAPQPQAWAQVPHCASRRGV